MPTLKSKFGILTLLVLCALFISTCTSFKHAEKNFTALEHQLCIQQLQKESAIQKLKSTKTIAVLKAQSDSLSGSIHAREQVIATQAQRIKLLSYKLFKAAQADTSCKQQVQHLEKLVAKRDSTLVIYKQALIQLREAQKEQIARIHCLTEQLNTLMLVHKTKHKFTVRTINVLLGFDSGSPAATFLK